MMPQLQDCPICQTKYKRIYCHYGGFSCDKCKVFFMRATKKKYFEKGCAQTSACIFKNGKITINEKVEKMPAIIYVFYLGKIGCKKCRYDKCLANLMDSHLVHYGEKSQNVI